MQIVKERSYLSDMREAKGKIKNNNNPEKKNMSDPRTMAADTHAHTNKHSNNENIMSCSVSIS